MLDYQTLPQAVEERILPFFKLSFSTGELQMMRQNQQQYSKNPQLLFQPDGWKQKHFDDQQSLELTRKLSPLYQQLMVYTQVT